MRRWYGLDEVPEDWGASVVTIGVFDGVAISALSAAPWRWPPRRPDRAQRAR